MVECSFKNYVVLGSIPVPVTSPSDLTPCSSKDFIVIQATIESRFTLKRVRHMPKKYSLMYYTDKY